MNIENPSQIYSIISENLDKIILGLNGLSENNQINEMREQAVQTVKKFSDKVKSENKVLEENAEWDTFTIALYGETNAGKSTLIEALRLLLNEEKKQLERAKFNEFFDKFSISLDDFEKSIEQLELHKKRVSELENDSGNVSLDIEKINEEFSPKLACISEIIQKRKQTMGVFQKLIHLFIKLEEEKELSKIKDEIDEKIKPFTHKVNEINQCLKQEQDLIKKLESKILPIQEKLEQLSPYADGAIIGDGSSDFTQESTEYKFSLGEQQFSLIDVPGIEGEESLVENAIWQAVKKAHSVFYITGKAARPQQLKDENKKGTLEKIQEHLGPQTEVWTIFNKRIASPRLFRKSELLDPSEIEGLDDLNLAMKSALGDGYGGYKTLSAKPAFLVQASNLLPFSKLREEKDKFLKDFSVNEILTKTGVTDFVDFLSKEIVVDYKDKIKRSNFNKVSNLLNNIILELDGVVEKFKDTSGVICEDRDNARGKIRKIKKQFIQNLKNVSRVKLGNLRVEIQKELYSYIDKDVSNDDLINKLESVIIDKNDNFISEIENEFYKIGKELEGKIKNILIDFVDNVYEDIEILISNIEISNDIEFKISFDIKSNVDWSGLSFSFGGIIVGILSAGITGGWSLLLSLASSFLSIGKNIVGFFNKNYKMSQQRSNIDKNLEMIESKLSEKINESISDIQPKIDGLIESKLSILDEFYNSIIVMVETFEETNKKFKLLSKSLENV